MFVYRAKPSSVRYLVLFGLFVGTWAAFDIAALAQEPSAPTPAARSIRVFLDCTSCDTDYLRQEVTFVDYVRDRFVADVHVLFSVQPTGNGGEETTLTFIGRGAFSGVDDALRHVASPVETPDEVRLSYARLLVLGLARYIARTPDASRVELVVGEDSPSRAERPTEDPWNYWVCEMGFFGDLSGEESSSTRSLSGFGLASRTTEAWKLQVGVDALYDLDRFNFDDEMITSVSRRSAVTGLVVKSLGRHWAVGVGGSVVSSTFTNQRNSVRFAPSIEYNIYPYDESSRRQVTISYAVGMSALRYREPTIFGKTQETKPDGRFHLFAGASQPWGTLDASLEASHFIDEPGNYRVVGFGSVGYRLVRGLSLDVSGGASLIRDQIYLPRRGASEEEVLLRRRSLATNYDYQFSIGLTFTFGSIFDSVVNSRLSGASGNFLRRF